MFKEILLAGAFCTAIAACEKNDSLKPKEPTTTIETTVIEAVERPEISALDACKFATEIKVRDMAASTNMVVTSETDNAYGLDFTTADGVTPVTCLFNADGVTKLTVGNSVANSGIIRPVLVENGEFLSISELPHIAGSKLKEEGSLVSFYTIFQTVAPSEQSCLDVHYKAVEGNQDSIFISLNGTSFENNPLPLTGDEKGVASFELPAESEVVTIRVTNRELPDVYGFEVKPCT